MSKAKIKGRKINKINRTNLREINEEIKSALKEVEDKFGVNIELGNSRFTDKNYTTKVKVAVVGDDGEAITKEVTAFKRNKKSYGINDKFEIGTRFETLSGNTFILDGLNTRAKKYPVLAHNRDGKFKLSVRQLNASMVKDY